MYRLTGKSTGNAFYNLFADSPAWSALAQLPDASYFANAVYSEVEPSEVSR